MGSGDGIRLAELIAALSIATDLGGDNRLGPHERGLALDQGLVVWHKRGIRPAKLDRWNYCPEEQVFRAAVKGQLVPGHGLSTRPSG
jgi:hypothetical protein